MKSLIDTSVYCITASFIQITMHLIKTSNIQTLFRTANYVNPNSSVVTELWLVSHKFVSYYSTIFQNEHHLIQVVIPTQNKTYRKLLYLHRVQTDIGEGE